MKYYIFDTEQEATAYDEAVTALHSFPDGDNWANPIKHPSLEKWAVAFSPKIEVEGKQAEELTEDWTLTQDV